jgi:hypothetical protein
MRFGFSDQRYRLRVVARFVNVVFHSIRGCPTPGENTVFVSSSGDSRIWDIRMFAVVDSGSSSPAIPSKRNRCTGQWIPFGVDDLNANRIAWLKLEIASRRSLAQFEFTLIRREPWR